MKYTSNLIENKFSEVTLKFKLPVEKNMYVINYFAAVATLARNC